MLLLRVAIGLAWAASVVLCLVFGRSWRADGTGIAGALVVTALLAAFAFAPPVRAFLVALPRGHRVIAATLLCAVLFGHMLGHHRATFPLVRWDMFTWVYEPERVIFHELVGIAADGTSVPLHFARIAPSLHGTFYWSLESWGEYAQDEERYGQIYSLILGAFGERYNARHPERPIRWVASVRGTIERGEGGALDVRRESLWRVVLDRGPGTPR